MPLRNEAKTAAVKGALAELIRMLGGMNMDRARKKKMGAMAPDADPSEIEEPEDGEEEDLGEDATEIEDDTEEAMPPRFRKKLKPKRAFESTE